MCLWVLLQLWIETHGWRLPLGLLGRYFPELPRSAVASFLFVLTSSKLSLPAEELLAPLFNDTFVFLIIERYPRNNKYILSINKKFIKFHLCHNVLFWLLFNRNTKCKHILIDFENGVHLIMWSKCYESVIFQKLTLKICHLVKIDDQSRWINQQMGLITPLLSSTMVLGRYWRPACIWSGQISLFRFLHSAVLLTILMHSCFIYTRDHFIHQRHFLRLP